MAGEGEALAQDLAKVFDDREGDRDFMRDYIAVVLENWRIAEASTARAMTVIAVLALGFLVVSGSGMAGVVIGGFTITDVAVVRAVLPVAIGYQAYVVMSSSCVSLRLLDLHRALLWHFRPEIRGTGLISPLEPPGATLGPRALITRNPEKDRVATFILLTAVSRFIVYLLAPIYFEVYAVWQLVAHPGSTRLLSYGCSGLTVLILLSTMPFMYWILRYISEE